MDKFDPIEQGVIALIAEFGAMSRWEIIKFFPKKEQQAALKAFKRLKLKGVICAAA